MQNQRNTNNGKNKASKSNVISRQPNRFANLKIKHSVAERFKQAATDNDMDYSEFLDELLKSDVFNKVFNDPQNREAMNNLLRHITKRALEVPTHDTDGYRF